MMILKEFSRIVCVSLFSYQGSLLTALRQLVYCISFLTICQELFRLFSKSFLFLTSGESGIRTHAPLRTNGFQDRLVMTTSIPLHLFICLPLPYHLSDKMYSITAFHCRQHLFQTFFIFFYFSYFPVFFIYKYTYFSLFIHRTCHRQLLLHILISTEPTIGKFFQMHGNSQIPAQDY